MAIIPNDPGSKSLNFTSPAFQNGEMIPPQYTCQGSDISPPLKWKGVPEETESLVMIMDDADAPNGTITHWVLFNLPPDTRGIPESFTAQDKLDNGAIQGKNDFGDIGYTGPRPPPGKQHEYYFRLYAIDTKLDLSPGATKDDVMHALKGHVIDDVELTGTYSR
ncbi:YbhB/YbcL family Raf kinase inhibitor-like protein [Methanocella sp. CWC-04]|uniref:YbhB/YbcL family Raf kinase inhibitor-like protein n=2 Tax=Methanooceanicella nereidis TaxID=2052831 RepID=A0AAP2RGV0_9EURY|nr:YbhB/YbcL family Raf kinase inhibitor-like protein [Methanocella sp. CWC-04]